MSKTFSNFFKLIIILASTTLSPFSFFRKSAAANPAPSVPQLGVLIVVDQFAAHYLAKIRPHLRKGLKTLLDYGVVYTNATYPHASPSTPTGHAALSTGTTASVHGIASYGWLDENNEFIEITDDPRPESLIFKSHTTTYDVGKSAKNLMTDTVADNYILESTPTNPRYTYSLSLKPRAAIGLAGHAGKAIWLDEKQGILTSSKAYFKELPDWLANFNAKKCPKNNDTFTWKLYHRSNHAAYKHFHVDDYRYVSAGNTLIDKPIRIDIAREKPFEEYQKTPFANELLFDAGIECIRAHRKADKNARLFMMISLSAFDYAGHSFGPHSREMIDFCYHLDKQLEKFINYINTLYPHQNVVYCLTSDHGVMPIPEILNEDNFTLPQRIDTDTLIAKVNKTIEEEFGVAGFVHSYNAPEFYFDRLVTKQLDSPTKEAITQRVKKLLLTIDGVKDCWTPQELQAASTSEKNASYKKLFYSQYYPGRSGDLSCLVRPYVMLTPYDYGTSHATPYRYDTHVPLIFYWPGKIEGKVIEKPVSMLQVAGSLARLLDCPIPSTANDHILPGLVDQSSITISDHNESSSSVTLDIMTNI